MERLINKVDSQFMNDNELIKVKEKWLEELRYRKIKLEKTYTRDARIRDNRMFREDEGMFYRRINAKKKRQGKVPEMNKYLLLFGLEFWKMILSPQAGNGWKQWQKI